MFLGCFRDLFHRIDRFHTKTILLKITANLSLKIPQSRTLHGSTIANLLTESEVYTGKSQTKNLSYMASSVSGQYEPNRAL